MKPRNIRVSTDTDARYLRAEYRPPGSYIRYLIVDKRFGNAIAGNVQEGEDAFRWLIRAARQHVAL